MLVGNLFAFFLVAFPVFLAFFGFGFCQFSTGAGSLMVAVVIVMFGPVIMFILELVIILLMAKIYFYLFSIGCLSFSASPDMVVGVVGVLRPKFGLILVVAMMFVTESDGWWDFRFGTSPEMIVGVVSGRGERLPSLLPLRTVHASFPAHGSSF
jgi:hypothetical protein